VDYLKQKLFKRENKYRRNYEIQESLYAQLEYLSEIYDATIPEIINICVDYLIQTQNVRFFERDKKDSLISRTIGMKESNIIGLEQLNEKYGVGISRLVNIAINNVLAESLEQ